jgi:predicted nucleic-acid-binding protein
LFEDADSGQKTLYTTESIIAEVVYVLQSKKLFNYSREIIVKNLLTILKLKGLKIIHKKLIILGLQIYLRFNIDFEDAVLASYVLSSKSKELFSYDHDFSKIDGLKRIEPK